MSVKQKTTRSGFLAGESGMGIDSSGEILMNALVASGLRCSADREYPSLIKGGQSLYTIHIGTQEVRSRTTQYDFGIALGKSGLLKAIEILEQGSFLLHNFEKWAEPFPTLLEDCKAKNIVVIYVPTRELLASLHLHLIFENTLMIGAAAHALGIGIEIIEDALYARYGKKVTLREQNKRCCRLGYDQVSLPILAMPHNTYTGPRRMVIDGNTALALGALNAGVRCYFAYPMSPSSSILSYIAKTAKETGVVVKQVEDEITAIQMNLGSMYAGARTLTATSGGGFDLMTETISLSGMTEVPLVCIIAQRPGPATGLPTRTAQADLHLAIYSGHGEFSRIVVAVSDQHSAFHLIQDAFDLAEQFQVPVIVLTEKVIAENHRTIQYLEQRSHPIERHLITDENELKMLKSSDRYAITPSGVSPRWLPGTSHTTYFCNGDEHHEDGTLDESEGTEKMIMKRIQKEDSIRTALPEPVFYGPQNATLSFIGRGSVKNPILDYIDQQAGEITINYLHCEFLHPLKTEKIKEFVGTSNHVCIIENNATGQLETLLKQKGITIEYNLRKRNGRPYTLEDIQTYVQNFSSSQNNDLH